MRDIVFAVCSQKQWFFSQCGADTCHVALPKPLSKRVFFGWGIKRCLPAQTGWDCILTFSPISSFPRSSKSPENKVVPVVFTSEIKPFTNYFTRHQQANNSPCYCLTLENTIMHASCMQKLHLNGGLCLCNKMFPLTPAFLFCFYNLVLWSPNKNSMDQISMGNSLL